MMRHVFDEMFVFIHSIDVGQFDSFPLNSSEIDLPPLLPGQYAVFAGDGWQVVNERPEKVPFEISKRQARQQLIVLGLIGSIQPAIDAIVDGTERALVQSFWDDSYAYERNHPQLIALGNAIGLDSAALDAAFIAASKL